MNSEQCHHIIIDWGTTNFRAFAMSKEHKLLSTKSLPLGLLQVNNGEFAQTLEQVLKEWLVTYQDFPIFMAGMVGSLKGWVNVDYVNTPANTKSLASNSYSFVLPWGAKAYIVPGVCHQYDEDKFDVMRGEEIQVLGLAQYLNSSDFVAILPGTHSKHITVTNHELCSFSSYLTGEMYSMLSKHSLLGKDLPENTTFDQAAFLRGVTDAQDGEFTQRIFLAWTHRLFQQLSVEQIADYLSGLLIGFELRKLKLNTSVYLVGALALCQKYQLAAGQLGINVILVDGNECFLQGMSQLIDQVN